MSDLLDEVLDEEKFEKRINNFRTVLPKLIIAATVIVVLFFAKNLWDDKKEENKAQNSDVLISVLQFSEHIQDSIAKLQKIEGENSFKQQEIAAIKIATLYIKNNKLEDAFEQLENIINQSGYSVISKQYAKLLWISYAMTNKQLNDKQSKKLEQLLYGHEPAGPFNASLTLFRVLHAREKGDLEKAKTMANAFISNNKDAPQIIKNQIKAIIAEL